MICQAIGQKDEFTLNQFRYLRIGNFPQITSTLPGFYQFCGKIGSRVGKLLLDFEWLPPYTKNHCSNYFRLELEYPTWKFFKKSEKIFIQEIVKLNESYVTCNQTVWDIPNIPFRTWKLPNNKENLKEIEELSNVIRKLMWSSISFSLIFTITWHFSNFMREIQNLIDLISWISFYLC